MPCLWYEFKAKNFLAISRIFNGKWTCRKFRFFDLDLYNQDKESLDSEDEEYELDKYEVKKDSLNIYEDDSKFGGNSTVAAETSTSIDESAVSSDWTKFATEDSE